MNCQGDTGEETAAGERGKYPLRGIYYGWVMVALGALAVFLSGPGQTYSVSTFIDPLIAEFGWSRSLVSGMYSAGTLTAGLLMTVIGRLVDNKGYRPMLTFIALAFSGALFFMSSVTVPTALFFGFMMIRTFGQGSLTLIPNSMVPQWFISKRGRALSVLAVGGALSSAVLPHVNLVLIAAMGWRMAWVFWGGVLALVLAPLAWILTRERPEEMGLAPDGIKARLGGSGGETSFEDSEDSWEPAEVVRTSAFWIILIASCIPSMVGTGAQFHHMSIMTNNGVALQAAAAVFTVAAATRLCLTPLAGWASDRFPIQRLLSLALVLQAINILFLLFTNTTLTAVILGMIQGTRMALQVIVGGVIWPHFFGRRYLASIRGVTTAAMVIASALGPLPFGLGYDIFGGYTEVLLGMAVLPLLGAAVVLFVRRPKRFKTATR